MLPTILIALNILGMCTQINHFYIINSIGEYFE